MARRLGLLAAPTYGLHLRVRGTVNLQCSHHGCGPLLAQGKVVLSASPLVRITLDLDCHFGVFGQEFAMQVNRLNPSERNNRNECRK